MGFQLRTSNVFVTHLDTQFINNLDEDIGGIHSMNMKDTIQAGMGAGNNKIQENIIHLT